ncbi:MAG: hypothetical protein LBI58_05425 [Tannerellaceae bacterium]|jgi:hypothetical protein|nr:hypothetical protein [Tannerellaceae bacterium]
MYPEDISKSTFDTASPCTIRFNGADRGKMVNFAIRWENNRGIKAPWSYIQTATIP